MGRSPLTITQGDIQRTLKAAKKAGLDVVRAEVDTKGSKITLVFKEDGKEQRKVVNSLDNAPSFWAGRKGRK